MVQTLLNYQNQSDQKLLELKHDLEAANCPNQGPHHKLYRDEFNPVDLHDGYWYSLDQTHSIYSWPSKLLVSILLSNFINGWITYAEFEYLQLIEFTELSIDFFLTPSQ